MGWAGALVRHRQSWPVVAMLAATGSPAVYPPEAHILLSWSMPPLPGEVWVAIIGVIGSLATIIVQGCISYRQRSNMKTQLDNITDVHQYRIRQLERALEEERRKVRRDD